MALEALESKETGRKHCLIDETGNRYGKLLVLRRGENMSHGKRAVWECRCDCGNIEEIAGQYLRKGEKTQCAACAAAEKKKARREHKEYIRSVGERRCAENVSMYETKNLAAENALIRIRKLRRKLKLGGKYLVAMKMLHAEGYMARCTLIAKYPKFALFESEHGIRTCLGYHAILTEEVLFKNELVPTRVTVQ